MSLSISPALLFTAAIAAGMVLLSLRCIAAEIDYAKRVQTLQQQTRVLREKQEERIRNLLPKRR